MKQYNWKNLKKMECPNCSYEIWWKKFQEEEFEEKFIQCHCGFTITEEEFNIRLLNISKKESKEYFIPDYEQNLSNLNNLKC